MKFVKILINNIFIPFATFLFILVGVFAALLSAIIEFAVLKELFTSEYQEFISLGITPRIQQTLLALFTWTLEA